MRDRFTPTERNYYIMWLFTLSLAIICYGLIHFHDLPTTVNTQIIVNIQPNKE